MLGTLSDLAVAGKHPGNSNNTLPGSLKRIALAATEIEIWQTRLDLSTEVVSQCAELLSNDERLRAHRFHYERHRRRFIVARGTLRVLIGGYLGIGAASIRFSYLKNGKPGLAMWPEPLRFNVSHAHERALFALSRQYQVGIDIEYLERDIAYRELVGRYFSPREAATLERFPNAERRHVFLTAWSRKEAVAKISGEGISAVSKNRIEVPLGPLSDPYHAQQWKLYEVDVENSYTANVAVRLGEH